MDLSTLYQGTNQRGTVVFTWAAQSVEGNFAAEISPLLQYLWMSGLVSAGSNLGLISFGTEGYHADGNVTFSLSNYHVDVVVGPAPTLSLGQIPTACPPSAAGRLQGPWLFGAAISGIVGALLSFL